MDHSASPRGFLFRKPSVHEVVETAAPQISLETIDSYPAISRSPRTSLDKPRPVAYDSSPRNLQSESARNRQWNSWNPQQELYRQPSNDIHFKRDEDAGLEPRDPSADILVLRIHSMTNIAPMRLPPTAYIIIPCVEVGDRNGEAVAGQPLGRFRADPDVMTPGYFAARVNSDCLRFYSSPGSLFYFKILEEFDGRKDVFGMVTLTGLPERILSEPTILPEQVINRPEFRVIFPIDGMDGSTRGELTLSALFDFSRPGEFAWPHPQQQVTRVQQQTRMRVLAAAKPTPQPPMFEPPRRRPRQAPFAEAVLYDLKNFCMSLPDTLC